MGFAAYTVANLLDSADSIAASTEDPFWNLARLHDKNPASVFKGTAAGVDIDVHFDGGAQPDAVILNNHNAPSDATVTVKADNTSPATTVRGTLVHRPGDMWIDLAGLTSYTDFRISITAGSLLVPSQLGELWLSQLVRYNFGHEFGFRFPRRRRVDNFVTERGVDRPKKKYEQELLVLDYDALDQSQLDFITALDAASEGPLKPLVVIRDVGASDVFMMRQDPDEQDLERANTTLGRFRSRLIFRELAKGKAVLG